MYRAPQEENAAFRHDGSDQTRIMLFRSAAWARDAMKRFEPRRSFRAISLLVILDGIRCALHALRNQARDVLR